MVFFIAHFVFQLYFDQQGPGRNFTPLANATVMATLPDLGAGQTVTLGDSPSCK